MAAPPATGAMLWNVCAQDLFEDLEPDETNTAFQSCTGSEVSRGREVDSLSDLSSLPSYSHRDSVASGSANGSGGPGQWGTPMMWYGNTGPPGLPPPPPIGLAPPSMMGAGKLTLWNAAVGNLQPQQHLGPSSAIVHAPAAFATAEAPVVGGPGTPMVLWCEATPTHETQVMEALVNYYGEQRPQVVHFWTPARFTRWLFEQPRGEVDPWALLIVGWREAKPSAMAIGAARSGVSGQLRPDGRRPVLPPVSGAPGEQVNVAVEAMVIVLEKPEHADRVSVWARDGGRSTAGCDIYVASDAASIHAVVSTLRAARELRSRKKVMSL
mmetsp:Transcript_168073/g.539729  ORF Transcript_168073/g.539729 Transcript_168073/m.539729 type:complete len:325 (+) Transcript_168073:91-1065(+)